MEDGHIVFTRLSIILAALVLTGASLGGCDEPEGDSAPARAAPPGPAQIDAALEAANTYLDTGRIGDALAITSRLVERAPLEPRGHEMHALVLIARAAEERQAGEIEAAESSMTQAADAYERAIEVSPATAGLHQSAGETAHAAGRVEIALDHYEAACELAPDDPKHHLYAGLALVQLDRLDDAEVALTVAVRLDPDLGIAHASRSTAALRQGRLDDALAHITEARAIEPSDASFRLQEAKVHRRRGDAQRGLEVLVGLPHELLVQEAFADEVAACYTDLGRHADAARTWERRLEAAPSSARAWYAAVKAAEAHAESGEQARARELLELAERLAPQAEEVTALRARLGE